MCSLKLCSLLKEEILKAPLILKKQTKKTLTNLATDF